MSDTTSGTDNNLLQRYSLSVILEQMPNGELITWLKTKLPENDFYQACEYIFELMVKQVYLVCEDEVKNILDQDLATGNFEHFFDTLQGLFTHPDQQLASAYQYQALSGLQNGFEIMAKRYNLDLNQ